MLARLSTAIAAICMLSGAALAQAAAKLTDPQIAHIAYTAGQLDIEAAKQAISMCVLSPTTEDNDTSRALTKQAADKRAELSKLNGAESDQAYVANEVAYHKTVNGALETTLIPSASNPELLLQTGLKIFQGHQQHAEEVAAALK
jgi:putative membrane protein